MPLSNGHTRGPPEGTNREDIQRAPCKHIQTETPGLTFGIRLGVGRLAEGGESLGAVVRRVFGDDLQEEGRS